MKNNVLMRMASLAAAAAMLVSLPLSAFAGTYDIAQGNIKVTAKDSDQYVKQCEDDEDSEDIGSVDNDEIVITGKSDCHTVEIDATEGDAKVTLKDVEIQSDDDDPAPITVNAGQGHTAEIELDGSNKLSADSDGDHAGLEIVSGSKGTVVLQNENNTDGSLDAYGGTYAAGIGTAKDGELAGTLKITGGTVSGNTGAMDGAAGTTDDIKSGAGIGTGLNGTLSGTVEITGGEVTGTSNSGAGIGTGKYGALTGTIRITDGTVEGIAKPGKDTIAADGAGIGTGAYGNIAGGSIEILGGEVTGSSTAFSAASVARGFYATGAGIGTGEYGSIQNGGGIHIADATVTGVSAASSDSHGAGIGTGADGTMQDGTYITIDGNAVVFAASGGKLNEDGTITYDGTMGTGAGIGGGYFGDGTGITIAGSSQVTAIGGGGDRFMAGAGIGGGYGGSGTKIKILGSSTVDARGGLGGAAGIGGGTFGEGDEITIKQEATGSVTAVGGSGNNATYGGDVYDAAGAGIGGGAYNTGTGIQIGGSGTVTAAGGNPAGAEGQGGAGIGGGGYAEGEVNITSGTVNALGGKGAAGIGGGAQTEGQSLVSIAKGVVLRAYADGAKFAVETTEETTDENVLNGRFKMGVLQGNLDVVFAVFDAVGNRVREFTLPAAAYSTDAGTYRSFAIDVPEGGTYYVFNADGQYNNAITGYTEPGTQIAYVVEQDDMLEADYMQFPAGIDYVPGGAVGAAQQENSDGSDDLWYWVTLPDGTRLDCEETNENGAITLATAEPNAVLHVELSGWRSHAEVREFVFVTGERRTQLAAAAVLPAVGGGELRLTHAQREAALAVGSTDHTALLG